ncbi:hypothetical protein ABSA28_00109 [Candidatus Hepatincolaceae symbiont of Richtersius coronifer]
MYQLLLKILVIFVFSLHINILQAKNHYDNLDKEEPLIFLMQIKGYNKGINIITFVEEFPFNETSAIEKVAPKQPSPNLPSTNTPTISTSSLSEQNLSSKKRLFLSLRDFVESVEFALEFNNNYTVQGWFVNPKNTIKINLKTDSIIVNSKSIPFTAKEVRIHENEIFISNSLLERIFPLRLSIDFSQLIIDIHSDSKLPIEISAENEKKRQNLKTTSDSTTSNVFYPMTTSLFVSPSLDLYLSSSYHKENKTTKDKEAVANIGGIFLGFDSEIYLKVDAGRNLHNQNSARGLFSKRFLQDTYYLKFLTFGDISSGDNALVDSRKSGRGLYMSSVSYIQSNQNNTITLEGTLLPGWEVEVYNHGLLLGFATPNDQGKYFFRNLETIFGLNVFKLVFYGPFGEIREEEKRFIVGESPVKQGEIGFEFSVLQADRKLVENSNEYAYNRQKNLWNTNLTAYYGILDNLNLKSTLSVQSASENPTKQREFYDLGLIYTLGGFSSEYNVALSSHSSNPAYNISLNGELLGKGYIFVSYSNFNKIYSNKSYISTRYAESLFETRYSYYFGLYGLSVPLNFGYKRIIYEPLSVNSEDKENEFYMRGYFYLFNLISLTIEDIQTYTESNKKNSIVYAVNANFHQLGFRGSLEQKILPYANVGKVDLTLDYNILDEKFYTYVGFMRDYSHNVYRNYYGYSTYYFTEDFSTSNHVIDDANNANFYKIGLAKTTRIGSFNLSAQSNFKGISSLNLTYGISFGYNNLIKRPYISGENYLFNQGNLAAKIFIDNNYNGIYDEGIDEPIRDATLTVNNNNAPAKSDEEGSIYLNNLVPYENLNFSVALESVDDIMILPKEQEIKRMLRPSITDTLQFALIKSGDLEGVIYKAPIKNQNPINNPTSTKTKKNLDLKAAATSFTATGKLKNAAMQIPVKSARVKLYSSEGEVMATSRSDAEGYYIFERIPYGTYYLKIESNEENIAKEHISKVFVIDKSLVTIKSIY